MTTPTPPPWLSPQVVIEKSFPKRLGIQRNQYRILSHKQDQILFLTHRSTCKALMTGAELRRVISAIPVPVTI